MPQAKSRRTENQETVSLGAGSIHSELLERSLATRRRALCLNATEDLRLSHLCDQIDSQARILRRTHRQETTRLIEKARQLRRKTSTPVTLHKAIIYEDGKTNGAEDRLCSDGLYEDRRRAAGKTKDHNHWHKITTVTRGSIGSLSVH